MNNYFNTRLDNDHVQKLTDHNFDSSHFDEKCLSPSLDLKANKHRAKY